MACNTVRMSRSPTGKSTSGMNVCYGSDGARGMGTQYSGDRGDGHKRNKLSWKDPKAKATKTSKTRPWGKKPDPMNVPYIREFANL